MPLIVGLGNPGDEYANTPHNVGFDVVERLAHSAGAKFKRGPVAQTQAVKLSHCVLLKPLSYMNLSGGPVQSALNFYKLPPSELFVICDDVNLPLGHLRLREKGGPGGHKGLISIIGSLGSGEFPRLRIGVGGGHPGADLSRHVLGKFSASDQALLSDTLNTAAEAVNCFLSSGLAAAMNRFNSRKPEDAGDNPSGE